MLMSCVLSGVENSFHAGSEEGSPEFLSLKWVLYYAVSPIFLVFTLIMLHSVPSRFYQPCFENEISRILSDWSSINGKRRIEAIPLNPCPFWITEVKARQQGIVLLSQMVVRVVLCDFSMLEVSNSFFVLFFQQGYEVHNI